MKIEVGKTYKTKAGFLATVVYDKFDGLYKDRNILVVGHRFNPDRGVPEDTVWTCDTNGVPNGGTKHEFCLVEEAPTPEATAKTPEQMLSLRDLLHAKHMLRKADVDEIRYSFDGMYPQTYTMAGVEKALKYRVGVEYMHIRCVSLRALQSSYEVMGEGRYVSFFSDGGKLYLNEKLWRSYSKEQVQRRIAELS